MLEWAWRLSSEFTGDAHYPFLMLFDKSGVVQRVVFGSAPERHEESEWRPLREGASAWLVYDPFDGPVYTYLAWDGLDQGTVERLIGRAFGEEDLAADGSRIVFPRKWGVMF
jgi:hypothetical protein